MKVLVLGGTRFLGRHVVDELLRGGHSVTLFNRGKTAAAGLFTAVPQVHGNRDGGLQALGDDGLNGAGFDAVVDTCGYVPRVVAQSCATLRNCGRYLFVSSVSAYAEPVAAGADESAALATLADAGSEDIPAHYGALKAACEQVVQRTFATRALIVRPGLIVGPHDPTGRFTYWPRRMAQGADVLAPGPRDASIQIIDARDLAHWMVRLLADGAQGTFNAAGPAATMTLGTCLEICRDVCQRVTGVASRLNWIDADRLLAEGVVPWTELPLWLGHEDAGMMQVSIAKALAQGLILRPLADTVADTLAWMRSDLGPSGAPQLNMPAGIGLSAERESTLLARLLNKS